MSDIICPYCNKELDINHDDGYGYQEDTVYNQTCEHCNKVFTYTTSISYSYEAEKADCLNGGKHDWKLTTTCPREASEMVCTMCNNNRPLTKEEKEKYNIGTLESYFKNLTKWV